MALTHDLSSLYYGVALPSEVPVFFLFTTCCFAFLVLVMANMRYDHVNVLEISTGDNRYRNKTKDVKGNPSQKSKPSGPASKRVTLGGDSSAFAAFKLLDIFISWGYILPRRRILPSLKGDMPILETSLLQLIRALQCDFCGETLANGHCVPDGYVAEAHYAGNYQDPDPYTITYNPWRDYPLPRKSSLIEETMNQFMLAQSNLEGINSNVEASNKNIEASMKNIEASNKNIEASMKNTEKSNWEVI
ncbi:hypothetical protein KIW84_023012 [Lathyrus oleraceus]|uniref:Uncharacterized protein n=1 Tax=Pisum sativum TaxID=3888 RepID=A0A9D5BBL8_PEA|nr:hypothetical protein KIW84_023012 [Pisum sativum]